MILSPPKLLAEVHMRNLDSLNQLHVIRNGDKYRLSIMDSLGNTQGWMPNASPEHNAKYEFTIDELKEVIMEALENED